MKATDQFNYQADLVLGLLPMAFDRLATAKYDADEDRGRGGGDPATGGNNLAHLADIRQWLPRLTAGQQKALYWHAHSEPSITGSYALGRLVQMLNGDR